MPVLLMKNRETKKGKKEVITRKFSEQRQKRSSEEEKVMKVLGEEK